MKLTKNFNKSEFNCSCGCDMPAEVLFNIRIVAENLQVLRDFVGSPIKVNSAYRCKEHNKRIGGASRSQHVLGKASDIVVKGFTPDEVYDIVQNLRRNPIVKGVIFQGLGRYNTFTHVDIRKNYATWDLRK
jgi:uncharacterized protein YcbK (DUF882 family)